MSTQANFADCFSNRHDKYGSPLWADDGQTGEIQIGDVGYLKDGKFKRLLNTAKNLKHYKIKSEKFDAKSQLVVGHPSASIQVEPIDTQGDGAVKDSPYMIAAKWTVGDSKEVQVGVVFVLLEDGEYQWMDDTISLTTYVREHGDSWARTLVKNKLLVRKEDLVLISGCVRAKRWAAAAFKGAGHYELRYLPETIPKADVFCSTNTQGTTFYGPTFASLARRGAKTPNPSEDLRECLFVKCIALKPTDPSNATTPPSSDPSGSQTKAGSSTQQPQDGPLKNPESAPVQGAGN